jgi:hypothetical protein
MHYKGIVTKEFIEQRNVKVAKDKNKKNPFFRWDSEFPEYHQVQIDKNQTLYEGFEYDTVHAHLGNLDYKMYSKDGVHVSDYIKDKVDEGLIDYFVVWMWNKPHEKLEEGMEVEYTILGFVDAKQAVQARDSKTKRFTFES